LASTTTGTLAATRLLVVVGVTTFIASVVVLDGE
jgi:hypothetical protein